MSEPRAGLERAIETKGWLSGQYHKIRSELVDDSFGFGVHGGAPWLEVGIGRDLQFFALYLPAVGAPAIGRTAKSADEIVDAIEAMRSSRPREERLMLRPDTPAEAGGGRRRT